ncbi:efflux RND transporter periplasmic adaptor subunit [uncultured Jannaschia sp.]|uniref:efflux RND transporter periplasmic adaptor subunit n=1 Tax=uncultured Jannaschia sp. TaxID=293347 RepID=UPI002626D519|nr:efflux RND transporter periplasmic adaptor subunit [uncultured Jannaschia sp.]
MDRDAEREDHVAASDGNADRPAVGRDTEAREDVVPAELGDRRLAAEREVRAERDGDDGQEQGREGGSHRKLWIWVGAAVLAVAVLLVALWWFGIWPFVAEEEGEDGPSEIPVSVDVARYEEIPVYYEYNGLTYASRQADIRPRVSGYIEEIAFEEGGTVAEGDLLYRLDARTFEAAVAQAEAEREALEASLAFAEAQVSRFSVLSDRGVATGERYDQALARREELQGRVAALDARIATTELNRQYTEVRAPFDGRIGLSLLNEGELASPGGAALTTIVQLDPIEVRFEIRDDELPRIRLAGAGDTPLRTVMLLEEDAAYAEYGVLEAIDNAIDTTTGTMTALTLFPNTEGMILPGRFVDLRLLLGTAEGILIPEAALTANLDRRIVYRVGPEDNAVATPVEVGRRFGDRVVIVSGLEPGDRVVTSNLQQINDGAPLVVPSPQPLAAPPSRSQEGEGGTARDMPRPAPLGPTGTATQAPQGGGLVVAPDIAGGGTAAGPAEVPLAGERTIGVPDDLPGSDQIPFNGQTPLGTSDGFAPAPEPGGTTINLSPPPPPIPPPSPVGPGTPAGP